MNLTFEEDKSYSYSNRTFLNAKADITIAIAINFNTAGEKCTKNAVLKQGKIYLPIDYSNIENILVEQIDKIVGIFNKHLVKTINIAGNGLYTFKNISQIEIDNKVYEFLKKIIEHKNLSTKIELIRSGGQTGVDEAGIKAALKLNIPAYILAPKKWKFRLASGNDYCDEFRFKERFENF